MADQNITELPIKTNTGVANTDYMLGIDASEGYQILVRDVAKYIMEIYNGSTLAGSAQTPKSAIDALNGNLSWIKSALNFTSVSGNGSKSFTVTNATKSLIIAISSNQNGFGMYFMFATGAGAITVIPVLSGSGYSFTTATNKLTINNTISTTGYVAFINFDGTGVSVATS